VAERLSSAKRVLYYYEHHVFRLLESVPDYVRDTFVANQIEGRNLDPVLLNTLKTYFALNRHVNETAATLYIHRNTLLFRLKKITDNLGLDPQDFYDSIALQALLYLLDLSQAERRET
jgi:carbohydrate diacid regulator